MLFQCLLASTLFYCAHWQKYVTGTLTFSTFDITEAQILMMLALVISAVASYFNVDFWRANFFSLGLLSLNQVVTLVTSYFGLLRLTPGGSFHDIISRGAGKNGATIAGTSVLSPLMPLLSVLVPAAVIAFKSEEGVFHSHPLLYIGTFGLIAAKIT